MNNTIRYSAFTSLILTISVLLVLRGVCFSQSPLWQRTNGPYGGFIYSLAINPEGHVFAGTNGAGVFRSTDKGKSWSQSDSSSLRYSQVLSLVTKKNGYIFAGTPGGIFRSSDKGRSWTQVLNTAFVNALAVDSTGYQFAGTANGIFRSADNGDSWSQASAGLANLYIWSLAADPLGNLFAATNGGGVFRSTDHGGT